MAETKAVNIYTGASGLVLPVKNKLLYPPEYQDKSRLTYYASIFNSLEVNSSFYKLPLARTVQRWAESVPAHFRFTFKLWQEVTHNKGLSFNPADLQLFFERISYAGEKKGCVLVQFPPSLEVSAFPQLELLLEEVRELNAPEGWKVAVEFRNRSWYEPEVYDLVHDAGACIVIQDLPASRTPMLDDLPDHVYVRFHGPNGGYRGTYPDEFLYEYAQYIREWHGEGRQVFVYFNNTMGDAVGNLILLNNYLKELEEDD